VIERSGAAIVWCAVVLLLGSLTLWEAPTQARRFRSDIEAGGGRSPLYRELQPARTVGLGDPRLFLAADRLVPREATFAVVTGRRAAITDPLVLRWVRPFARYWLFPRRLVRDAARADWILSYGADLSVLGLRFARMVVVGPGIALAEVAAP
jgi:hypothetical protein